MELKRINDHVSVAPQISPDDMPAIKAAGFTTVINNRPDGESPDQPASATMKAAAESAGLAYHHIPLGRDGVSPQMVEETEAVLEGSDGPVLAFCRSGTRSTLVWALARGRAGDDFATLARKAQAAGYDLGPIRGFFG